MMEKSIGTLGRGEFLPCTAVVEEASYPCQVFVPAVRADRSPDRGTSQSG